MNKSINVGLVGAGWIGRVHAEAYARAALHMSLEGGTAIRLHTVADVVGPLARSAAEQYGFHRWTEDWRELIVDREIDLVDICVQNSLHCKIALAAARAGKHILCEKPLSSTQSEAEEMVHAVRQSGVKAMVAFNYRQVPALSYARKLLEEGVLGKVYHFRSVFTQDFATDPLLPMSWRFTQAAGGGSLVTMGSHVLDAARWLVGEIDAVAATVDTYLPERPAVRAGGPWDGTAKQQTEVEDTAHLLLRFHSGATGMVQTSWLSHGRKHHFEIEINGAEGSLFFNSERLNELQICERSDPRERRGFKIVYMGEEHPHGQVFGLKAGMGLGIKETFVLQACALAETIRLDRRESPSFADGMEADRVIRAAYQSAQEGHWIKV